MKQLLTSLLLTLTTSSVLAATEITTLKDFQGKVLVTGGPHIVMLKTAECQYCELSKENFGKLEAEFTDHTFYTVDISKADQDLVDFLAVPAVPVFAHVKAGKIVGFVIGYAEDYDVFKKELFKIRGE